MGGRHPKKARRINRALEFVSHDSRRSFIHPTGEHIWGKSRYYGLAALSTPEDREAFETLISAAEGSTRDAVDPEL